MYTAAWNEEGRKRASERDDKWCFRDPDSGDIPGWYLLSVFTLLAFLCRVVSPPDFRCRYRSERARDAGTATNEIAEDIPSNGKQTRCRGLINLFMRLSRPQNAGNYRAELSRLKNVATRLPSPINAEEDETSGDGHS